MVVRAEMRIDEAKGDSEKRKTNADASLQALKQKYWKKFNKITNALKSLARLARPKLRMNLKLELHLIIKQSSNSSNGYSQFTNVCSLPSSKAFFT
jgi:hypothetical protein